MFFSLTLTCITPHFLQVLLKCHLLSETLPNLPSIPRGDETPAGRDGEAGSVDSQDSMARRPRSKGIVVHKQDCLTSDPRDFL